MDLFVRHGRSAAAAAALLAGRWGQCFLPPAACRLVGLGSDWLLWVALCRSSGLGPGCSRNP